MVPIMEKDSILPLECSILYKEYNLTRFNHHKKRYSLEFGVDILEGGGIGSLKCQVGVV